MSDFSSATLIQEEVKAQPSTAIEMSDQFDQLCIVDKPVHKHVSHQEGEESKTVPTKETDPDQCETSVENGKKYTQLTLFPFMK